MLRIYAAAFLFFCLVMVIIVYLFKSMHQIRQKNMIKGKSRATMFDVRRLIMKGEKTLAIRVYGEIFETNSKETREAVEELERSIKESNTEFE